MSQLAFEQSFFLKDEGTTERLGSLFSKYLTMPTVVYLTGEIGAGKTTFVRGFLKGSGFLGSVKSPTYTLVEEYYLNKEFIYHFDLYRLQDPEELEFIGIRDYFSQGSIIFIEWPENGGGFLKDPHFVLNFTFPNEGRLLKVHCVGSFIPVLKNIITEFNHDSK